MEKTHYVELQILVPPNFGYSKFSALHLADTDLIPLKLEGK